MASDLAPAAPVTFGRYTLLEKLAVGGMAEVFRAKIHSSHGFEKILVVKRILPHLAADPSFVAMFIDEAKLTAQLTHPKIVQILDFGEVNGQYFTALEFVDGFDALGLLRIAAQKRVRVPPPVAVFIVQEILEALDYAHNARDMEGKPMQIVHRDISPSNIFVSKRGDVKLGDFGIAHAERRDSKTQAGTLKGKYGYMSPEQVVGRPIDARSDLFAIGVVLAELLTGRRLFSAAADLDVLLKVRDVRLDRLDKYGDRHPAGAGRHRARRPQEGSRRAPADRVGAARPAFRLPVRGWRTHRPRGAARVRGQAAGRRPGDGRAAAAHGAPQREKRRRRRGAPGDGNARAPAARASAPLPEAPPPSRRRRPATASAAAEDPWAEPERDRAFLRPPIHARVETRREPPGSTSRRPRSHSDIGRFVSAAPARPPDSAGDLSIITPMRLLADLAVAAETGLLRFESRGSQKGDLRRGRRARIGQLRRRRRALRRVPGRARHPDAARSGSGPAHAAPLQRQAG